MLREILSFILANFFKKKPTNIKQKFYKEHNVYEKMTFNFILYDDLKICWDINYLNLGSRPQQDRPKVDFLIFCFWHSQPWHLRMIQQNLHCNFHHWDHRLCSLNHRQSRYPCCGMGYLDDSVVRRVKNRMVQKLVSLNFKIKTF